MRKIIITLAILLSISGIASAQKYQGSISAFGTAIGFGANTSHGARIGNEYIGLGTEYGIWTVVLAGREWASVYADYQHYFPVAKSSSIFVQGSPGACWTDYTIIGDADDPETREKYNSIRACAKLGAGYDWQFSKCGISISFQAAFFAPKFGEAPKDSEMYWVPSFQLSFHW